MRKSGVYIGTSGFFYPHWGKGIFYPKDIPQKNWFEYYCQHFNTVELNVSFYRLPKKETFASWRKKAGPPSASRRGGFVFSIKGSRYITHIKRLKDCQGAVGRFFEAAGAIKDGKDVVLWQLPPRTKANPERFEEFFKILPKAWRYAFEFRHETWLDKKIYQILMKYNSAVVFQDFPDWPMTEEITANFVYLRFHGKTHLYTSGYSDNELKEWSRKVDEWMSKGLDIYAYFNNDALGYATENARDLEKFIQLVA